jgi:hypothetical protein
MPRNPRVTKALKTPQLKRQKILKETDLIHQTGKPQIGDVVNFYKHGRKYETPDHEGIGIYAGPKEKGHNVVVTHTIPDPKKNPLQIKREYQKTKPKTIHLQGDVFKNQIKGRKKER